jgi:cyanophycin synthetase
LEDVSFAFNRARRYSSKIVIESFIEGEDHRLVVIDGQFVAAAKRLTPFVSGDGIRTIRELIDELNSDPRRDNLRLFHIKLDEELDRLLNQASCSLDTVLDLGESFRLRSMANIAAGGFSVDVTDSVHPDNIELAIRAAQAIGISVAGMDYLTPDITKSYKEIGGAIIEVNTNPSLGLHRWPVEGKTRDVGGAIIESIFPPGETGRVPIALTLGSDRVAWVLERILRNSGTTVALSAGKGASINGEPTGCATSQGHLATRSVLRDPRVEVLIDTVSPGQIVHRGLVHELCDVAAIMDPDPDSDYDEYLQGLKVVLRATSGKLAVAANNSAALEILGDVDPRRLILVSRNAERGTIRRHLEAGGKAATTARDHGRQVIVLLEGRKPILSVPVDGIPALVEEPSRLKAYLFAVAMAYGMGVSAEDIAAALDGVNSQDQSPPAPTAKGAAVRNERAPTPIQILSASILSGFNVHHSATVIRQDVYLGEFAELRSSAAGPDFAQRFIDRFNGFKRLPTDPGLPADFLERLKSAEGIPFVEVLFRAVMAVEGAMVSVMLHLNGIDFAEIVPSPTPGHVAFVWRCRVPKISRRSAHLALTGLRELLPEGLRWEAKDGDKNFEAAYRAHRALARRPLMYQRAGLLIEAAERKGIPWEPAVGRLTRLGQGKFQQIFDLPDRKLASHSKLSMIASKLANDKVIANRIMAASGLPVPQQVTVDSIAAAPAAARKIGYPVVIKPNDSSLARGVSVALKVPDELPAAYERARREGSRVIVESFLEGDTHRMLVAGGSLIAACRQVVPSVTGDGKSTIGDLIKELNADPRRDGSVLSRVPLDQELTRTLRLADYEFDTVLEKGENFKLRSLPNQSTGSSTIDVTNHVHQDNRDLAIRAAQTLGLWLAGVDFITPDIGQSYKDVGGGINEINARPSIKFSAKPTEGEPQDVAALIIESTFPPGDQGQLPVAAVAGRENESVARTLDRILRSARPGVALVTDGGATVDGNQAGLEKAGPQETSRSVMRDRRVEALVRTVAPEHVAQHGLLHEICTTAAIMEPAGQKDGDVRCGIGVVVAATRGVLVVEAASAAALASVRGIDPDRVVMVSRDATNTELLRHLEAGGKVATTARDRGRRMIVLLDGDKTALSIPIDDVPALADGAPGLKAHLFAIALARGMGLSSDEIIAALGDKRTQPKIHHPDRRSNMQRSAAGKKSTGKTKKRAPKPAMESP